MMFDPADLSPVLVARSGSAGWIGLNRPKALNSLTLDMVRRISQGLADFEQDPDVALVVLTGQGERGFCAGGDIRVLYESAKAGDGLAETFWREEYPINAHIGAFSKPVVAVMDGITMGGGIGLAGHAGHRIATERSRIAMPEVGIGFFPDVGGTWLLSRGKSETGTYLGLTGEIIGAGDALFAGLADSFVPAADLPDFFAALCALPAGASDEQVAHALAEFARTPEAGPVEAASETINRCFAFDSVEEILDALLRDGSEFSQETRATMLSKSPTSLKITLRLLREGRRSSSLEACIDREFAASFAVLASHDFREGVRAAIIDKDRNPRWQPATLAAVDEALVETYFPRSVPSLFAAD